MFSIFKKKTEKQKQIEQRIVLAKITDKELEEFKELNFEIRLFGSYDPIEDAEINEINMDIAEIKKTEREKFIKTILEKYGVDRGNHVLWSDGIITTTPDNYAELTKNREEREALQQEQRLEKKLKTMAKYGLPVQSLGTTKQKSGVTK